MRASVEYIAEKAEEALASPIPETKRVVMGGFSVDVPDNETPTSVGNYTVHRDTLKKKLEEAGVTPMAVVPTGWWNKVVEEAGLFTVPLNNHGQVWLDPSAVPTSSAAARGWILTSVSYSLLLATGIWVGTTDSVAGLVAFFISFVIVAGFVAIRAEGDAARTARLASRWLRLRWLGRSEELFTRMFVRPNAPASYSGYRGVNFTFPTPPEDVGRVVAKVFGSELKSKTYVAATYDAFNLSMSPIDVLCKSTEERIIRERTAADPIIFVTVGSATAIVAQYGDFPIEKETVDRVVRIGTITG